VSEYCKAIGVGKVTAPGFEAATYRSKRWYAIHSATQPPRFNSSIICKRGSAAVVSCCSYGKGRIVRLIKAETTKPIIKSYYGTLLGSHVRSFRIRQVKLREATSGGKITMMSYPVGNKISLSRKPNLADK